VISSWSVNQKSALYGVGAVCEEIEAKMKLVLKVLKWAAVAVACALALIQFIRPARTNPAIDPARTIEARMNVTPEVSQIFTRSCDGCHSNKTVWPWYSNIAPVSWFVIDHVNHGRSHLNFSTWAQYDEEQAAHLLKNICAEVRQGSMPMRSYTRIHGAATLSPEDVKVLCDWAGAETLRRTREAKVVPLLK
jgi:hypothetical protein